MSQGDIPCIIAHCDRMFASESTMIMHVTSNDHRSDIVANLDKIVRVQRRLLVNSQNSHGRRGVRGMHATGAFQCGECSQVVGRHSCALTWGALVRHYTQAHNDDFAELERAVEQIVNGIRHPEPYVDQAQVQAARVRRQRIWRVGRQRIWHVRKQRMRRSWQTDWRVRMQRPWCVRHAVHRSWQTDWRVRRRMRYVL